MANTLIKKIIIFSLIIFFISFGIYTTWRTHERSTDFDTYYCAAKDASSGSPIYSEHKDVSPYIYPPFFACLIAPLSFVSMEAASVMWYALNLIFFIITICLCLKMIFDSYDISYINNAIPLVPKALIFIVITALLIDNVSMLQVNVFLLFLVVSGLYFFRKGLDVLAALFLAAAISIKIIPVIFLFYFIIKREVKMCVFTVLWTLFFSLVVPAFYMGTENAWNALMGWGGEHVN